MDNLSIAELIDVYAGRFKENIPFGFIDRKVIIEALERNEPIKTNRGKDDLD